MLNELDLARNQKPIIFIYTARSCADCRAFMSSWTKIDKVTVSSITAQFLSVLVLDDYMFDMTHFSPLEIDYLPRVFFADPDGTLRKDVTNPEADTSSPYYYESAQQVVEVMRGFLQGHWESLGTDVFKADLINDV